jgi:hypothetical protein
MLTADEADALLLAVSHAEKDGLRGDAVAGLRKIIERERAENLIFVCTVQIKDLPPLRSEPMFWNDAVGFRAHMLNVDAMVERAQILNLLTGEVY